VATSPSQSGAWLLLSWGLTGCGPTAGAPAPVATPDPCYAPYLADLRSAGRGRCAVARRGCDNCHQSPDAALGTLSGSDTPRLGTTAFGANLTPDPATGLGLWSSDQIVYAIHFGLDLDRKPLCFTMPRFDVIQDDEAYAIAHYLESLPPVHHEVPRSLCPPVKTDVPAGDGGSDALDDAHTPGREGDGSSADTDVLST
jgi:hypothetical protein